MFRKAIVLGLAAAAFWGSVATAQNKEVSEGAIGMAAGDVDNLTGTLASSAQKMTIEIERLLALPSLSADENEAVTSLLLARNKLQMQIAEIQSSAHETRKHLIEATRN
jgi:hypothetical protein